MIEITRSQARILRSVLRRAMNLPARGPLEPQVFEADQHGLTVRVVNSQFAAEYRIEGSREVDTLVIPPSLLVDCEGRSKAIVIIETIGRGRIASQWSDGNVPQLCTYAPASEALDFPVVPSEFVTLHSRFGAAYRAAVAVRDQEPSRYAIDHILLRGKTGEIAGTDGKQVFLASGFDFPFEEDVLVPATGVFSCSDFRRKEISMAKTDDWLAVRIGPLTLLLRINKEGRFPEIKDIIPRHRSAPTTLTLTESDAVFLGDAIKRLPDNELGNHSVTVDLNGSAAVRAVSKEGEQMAEVVLTNSTASGEPLRFVTNPEYLARAVSFGFREFLVYGAGKILACGDDHRRYAWMLLGTDGTLAPRQDAQRIESPKADASETAEASPARAKVAVSRRMRTGRVGRSAQTC